MHKYIVPGLRVITHIGALLPLVLLVWDFAHGGLTVNPIEEITLRTGKATLILLLLSLAATPINIVFGIKPVLRLRRLLGLYAFMYACLHFLTFVGLDYGFNLNLIREDIFQKRFALVGLAAFLSLLLLAVTSNVRWMNRLGKNWERLHWLIYLAAVLAVTHFTMQTRADLREPLLYVAVVVLLLIVRLPGIRKAISRVRHQAGRE